MKILFINSLADTKCGGGAEVILWEQVRGLRKRGYECVVLATSNEPGLQETHIEGVRVWLAGIRNLYWPAEKNSHHSVFSRAVWHAADMYNLPMQRFVEQVVSAENPDIASLHNLAGWSAATYDTLNKLNVPSVQILHDYYLICAKSIMRTRSGNCERRCASCRLYRLPHRRLTKQPRAVIGVSGFVLNKHTSLGYFSDVPIRRVIYNTRDPESLGITRVPNFPERAGGAVRFGYIGTLSPMKGVALLARVFRTADLGNATLWIAGTGPEEYENQLRTEFSDDRIQFKGRMNPHDFYSQVDVVVVPSLCHDNLPTVVFESLAFGKPVIGSRRGGIPEMITHGDNGLLFDPEAANELSRCLHKINYDQELRERLKKAAVPSSAPFIDSEGWIDEYERLYLDASR